MASLDTSMATADLTYQQAASRAMALQPQSGGIPLGGTPAKTAAVKKAAKDFEAMFMSSMLESMSAGIKPDKTFGGGQGEQIYRSMLNQEYGKALASTGTLGIADAIEREMLKMQEHSQK